MARKITMGGQSRKSVAEVFDDFVVSQTAQGLSDITVATYNSITQDHSVVLFL